MQSCIIIAPVDRQADIETLAGVTLTQEWGQGFVLAHFTPTPEQVKALSAAADLVQVIDTDDPKGKPWGQNLAGAFVSATQDGWRHRATVDAWPSV